MSDLLNDPVAIGAVILAILLNMSVIGLQWQAATNKRKALCERNIE